MVVRTFPAEALEGLDANGKKAVREAATANKIPVDDIIEIPVVLLPQ